MYRPWHLPKFGRLVDPTGLLHCALYRGGLNRRRKGHRNLTIKYVHAICTVEEVKPNNSLL